MSKIDAATINVLNDRSPTITLPSAHTVTEGSTTSIGATVNTGVPGANSMSAHLYSSSADALNDRNRSAIPVTLIPATLNGDANVNRTVTAYFTAPQVTGQSRQNIYYLGLHVNITGQGSRNSGASAVCTVAVINAIPASISLASVFTAIGGHGASLPFQFNPGSPTATEIRHSWHRDAASAANNNNVLTTGVPTVALNHTALTTLAGRTTVTTENGQITFTAPVVSAQRQLYGRIEIVQGGSVVAFDTYRVAVNPARQGNISIANARVMETASHALPVTYDPGLPTATAFGYSWHTSQGDANSGANPVTSGIPTGNTFSPTTPHGAVSTAMANFNFTAPVVTADRILYLRVTITQGGVTYYDTAAITIWKRIPASIDMPETVNVNENDTVTISGTYVTGDPPATAFGNREFPSLNDAENRTNEHTGNNRELTITLNPTTPVITGDRSVARPLEATVQTPSVSRDEDFGILWSIIQASFS